MIKNSIQIHQLLLTKLSLPNKIPPSIFQKQIPVESRGRAIAYTGKYEC